MTHRRSALQIRGIGAVELANAVVGQSGPGAYGVRARLVLNETQRDFEAAPVAAVAIVVDAHRRAFVLKRYK